MKNCQVVPSVENRAILKQTNCCLVSHFLGISFLGFKFQKGWYMPLTFVKASLVTDCQMSTKVYQMYFNLQINKASLAGFSFYKVIQYWLSFDVNTTEPISQEYTLDLNTICLVCSMHYKIGIHMEREQKDFFPNY